MQRMQLRTEKQQRVTTVYKTSQRTMSPQNDVMSQLQREISINTGLYSLGSTQPTTHQSPLVAVKERSMGIVDCPVNPNGCMTEEDM